MGQNRAASKSGDAESPRAAVAGVGADGSRRFFSLRESPSKSPDLGGEDVNSELMRPVPNSDVVAWVDGWPAGELAVTAVTIAGAPHHPPQ